MEERMTICNMTIEGGGRAGMIAPDETTFDWVEAARARRRTSRRRCAYWRTLHDRRRRDVRPRDHRRRERGLARRHLGHEPRPGRPGHRRRCPQPSSETDERSLVYMGLEAGTPMQRAQARPRVHRLVHQRPHRRPARRRGDDQGPQGRLDRVSAMVVPGSQQVAKQAESEGLDEIFRAAGFDWRTAGCSMCLGMNPDILEPGRALRVDLEPQLRGPPGPRRAHPPRLPADGGRGRDRGPLRRHPGVELDGSRSRSSAGPSRRSSAPTSTPTRSSPSSSSSGSSAPASASSCSTTGRRSPAGACPRTRSSPPAPNFGCGSSREHAPWALQDYGFKAIVASSLRRHLLLQLHEDRPAAGRAARGGRPGADGGGRGRGRPRGARGPLRRPRRARSSSTPSAATGCSTGSTTSRSRSRRPRTSPPTRPSASAPVPSL